MSRRGNRVPVSRLSPAPGELWEDGTSFYRPSGDPRPARAYLSAGKGASKGIFGDVTTGDAEADAMMKELGQKILKVCAATPKITVHEAIQKAMMEEN